MKNFTIVIGFLITILFWGRVQADTSDNTNFNSLQQKILQVQQQSQSQIAQIQSNLQHEIDSLNAQLQAKVQQIQTQLQQQIQTLQQQINKLGTKVSK